ncbi:MAG: hypothetical protein QM813_09315 [Verrucomicrobiota bacterium]
MFKFSDLTDAATEASDLLKSGYDTYKSAEQTLTGKTTTGARNATPQTAADVAAAAPVKQPFNWKPWAIGAAIVAAIGAAIYFWKE